MPFSGMSTARCSILNMFENRQSLFHSCPVITNLNGVFVVMFSCLAFLAWGNPRYAIKSVSQPSLIIRLPFRVNYQLCSRTLFTLHLSVLSVFAANLFSFLTVTLFSPFSYIQSHHSIAS